jgi:hypothetical protein
MIMCTVSNYELICGLVLRKKANILESSASSDAEVSQDSVLSENVSTEQPAEEDPKRTTPTSPLLTHLLKSPASTSQVDLTRQKNNNF